MKKKVKISPVTWGIAIKFWWWATWRSMLVSFPIGFAVGFFLSLPLALLNIEIVTWMKIIFNVTGYIVGLIVYIFFLKKALNRKYKGFTIVTTKD